MNFNGRLISTGTTLALIRSSVYSAFILLASINLDAKIISKSIDYKHNGTDLQGYLVYDDTFKETMPGILVIHEWWGLNDYAKKRATQLAKLGFVAFALDMYGKDVLATTSKDAGKLAGKLKKDRTFMRARAKAGLEVLRNFELTDKERLAAIGYCFGGTSVLELARSGADLIGVVSFHGGLETPYPEDAKDIKCKILVLHGADDPYVKSEEIAAFEKEMRNANVNWELIKYSDAVHAFTNPESGNDKTKGAAYNENADRRSWQAMKNFFHEIFNLSEHAENVTPLLIGSSVPDITLKTIDGKSQRLLSEINGFPAVLIFYRGGWCPFCNMQLSQLQKIKPELIKLGFKIVAISPDLPENLKASIDKHVLDYTLLSDSKMDAAKSFGIAFKVNKETIEKYKGYGIDLEKSSGEKHHMLPIPSVFIIGADNIIKFSYVNPDYKIRLDSEILLAVAKSALKKKKK